MAQKDRISGMPDEILVHILSFLTTEDAIKTTLLKRFGNLWRFVRMLDFRHSNISRVRGNHEDGDDNPYFNEKFMNLIPNLLIHHGGGEIDEMRLQQPFSFLFSKDPRFSTSPDPVLMAFIASETQFAGVTDSLVSFAITKRCKVLNLDFYDNGYQLHRVYILPSIVYTSIYLTRLTLCFCDITSCGDHEVGLKSLKLLHVRRVVMTDKAMDKMLSGCPLLEELSVEWCPALRNLCCSNNINLKKLKIDKRENSLLRLWHVNILSLKITGSWLESVVTVNSSVVYANLSPLLRFHNEGYDGYKLLLQSLDQCTTLKTRTRTLMEFARWWFTNSPCPCFNWKHLVLKLELNNTVQVGLSKLLLHVPMVETVTIRVRRRLPPIFNEEDVEEHDLHNEIGQPVPQNLVSERLVRPWLRWNEEFELDEDKHWNGAEAASLENLKTVVIHGDAIEDSAVIHVAKFLLRNTVALEKMVISRKKFVKLNDPSYNFTSGSMVEPEKDGRLRDDMKSFEENLLTSHKASTKGVIYFT